MEVLAPPSQAAPLGDGYSNYDHEFDIPEAELAERLRSGAVAPHAAWDHWGTISRPEQEAKSGLRRDR